MAAGVQFKLNESRHPAKLGSTINKCYDPGAKHLQTTAPELLNREDKSIGEVSRTLNSPDAPSVVGIVVPRNRSRVHGDPHPSRVDRGLSNETRRHTP